MPVTRTSSPATGNGPRQPVADVHSQPPARTPGPIEPIDRPVTLRTIRAWVAKHTPFSCLTCYDFTTAQHLQRAGVPVLLVGDSASDVILGLPGTIHAPLELLLTLTAAVKRGAPNCLVMGDMPFMSYQPSAEMALVNAGRFMTEGRADAVKVEVDRSHVPLVERMSHAGVPVVAHLGLKPQHVKRDGGYRYAGRTAAEARELITTACAMEDAGATMILLEAMPNEVSARIVERTSVPIIGCGAGPACHGQIVVTQDILGLTERPPSFAQPLVDHGSALIDAAAVWNHRVKSGELGEHPYRMNEGEHI